jgi:hypothetical protein
MQILRSAYPTNDDSFAGPRRAPLRMTSHVKRGESGIDTTHPLD